MTQRAYDPPQAKPQACGMGCVCTYADVSSHRWIPGRGGAGSTSTEPEQGNAPPHPPQHPPCPPQAPSPRPGRRTCPAVWKALATPATATDSGLSLSPCEMEAHGRRPIAVRLRYAKCLTPSVCVIPVSGAANVKACGGSRLTLGPSPYFPPLGFVDFSLLEGHC